MRADDARIARARQLMFDRVPRDRQARSLIALVSRKWKP
jgi:hypothetical protein